MGEMPPLPVPTYALPVPARALTVPLRTTRDERADTPAPHDEPASAALGGVARGAIAREDA